MNDDSNDSFVNDAIHINICVNNDVGLGIYREVAECVYEVHCIEYIGILVKSTSGDELIELRVTGKVLVKR